MRIEAATVNKLARRRPLAHTVRMTMSANKLVGLMAEPERRRVMAALTLASGDLDHIVSVTGLELRQVANALERLTSASLVEVGGNGVYVLLEETFKLVARSSQQQPNPGHEQSHIAPDDQVINQSIVDGRLVHLPRKRSKRLVVLDFFAQLFEPGAHYSERQVNATLRAFDDDVATLRRYLVDEGFLDRADGSYWRSGGTVKANS